MALASDDTPPAASSRSYTDTPVTAALAVARPSAGLPAHEQPMTVLCVPVWARSPMVVVRLVWTPSPSTVTCQSAASLTTRWFEGSASVEAPHSTLFAPPKSCAICAVGVICPWVKENVPSTCADLTCADTACSVALTATSEPASDASPCCAKATPAPAIVAPRAATVAMANTGALDNPCSLRMLFFIVAHSPCVIWFPQMYRQVARQLRWPRK